MGGTGGPDPLENYKNIGFLSNTGPDPLKITKLPIQRSMLDNHRPASETPFKLAFRWPANSGIWILSLLIKLKKNVVKVGPPLTKLSGSVHVWAIFVQI